MKKVLGYIFLVIGSLLGLAIVAQLPQAILKLLKQANMQTEYGVGYVMGFVVSLLIMGCIAFLLIRFGLKWISKKNDISQEIDNISGQ